MDTDRQIDGFLVKFAPAIEADLRVARGRLRSHFPRGFELVFDNYNALVFGFAATDRSRDAFISIAGYPRWITLFFLDGASLDDPERRLAGDGKQVRGVRLARAADLDDTAVEALIAQAIARHAAALAIAPPLATHVRMVAAKQRPRRPTTPPARKRGVG